MLAKLNSLSTVTAAEKLRDLHFDVLIALTAQIPRCSGSSAPNRADFEAIQSHCKFQLEVW